MKYIIPVCYITIHFAKVFSGLRFYSIITNIKTCLAKIYRQVHHKPWNMAKLFSSNCKWTYSLLYSWRITTFWHSLDNTDNFFKVWERHGLELGMNFLVVHQNFKRLFATDLAFDLHTRNCSLYDPKTKSIWSVKLNWYSKGMSLPWSCWPIPCNASHILIQNNIQWKL